MAQAKNAIGILGNTNDEVTDFIKWARATIRYTLTYCGATVGAVSDEDVDTIWRSCISEVESERHAIKENEQSLASLTDADVQALVYRLVTQLAARTANITSAITVNGVLEQFAGLMVHQLMTGAVIRFELAHLKAICPALGNMVQIKLDMRKSDQRLKEAHEEQRGAIAGKIGAAGAAC